MADSLRSVLHLVGSLLGGNVIGGNYTLDRGGRSGHTPTRWSGYGADIGVLLRSSTGEGAYDGADGSKERRNRPGIGDDSTPDDDVGQTDSGGRGNESSGTATCDADRDMANREARVANALLESDRLRIRVDELIRSRTIDSERLSANVKAGRQIAHAIKNELQTLTGSLSLRQHEQTVSDLYRDEVAQAVDRLVTVGMLVDELHQLVRNLEPHLVEKPPTEH